MQTAVVQFEDIKGVVRNRTRRTPLTEAEYVGVLQAYFPDSVKINISALETNPDAAMANRAAVMRAVSFDPFCTLAARLQSVTGAGFTVGDDGRFATDQLRAAYEHWLNEDEDGGFWEQVRLAIAAMDAPKTPAEQMPPAALTEAQKKDPNFVSAAKSGKGSTN